MSLKTGPKNPRKFRSGRGGPRPGAGRPNKGLKQKTVRLPARTVAAIQAKASEEGISFSAALGQSIKL